MRLPHLVVIAVIALVIGGLYHGREILPEDPKSPAPAANLPHLPSDCGPIGYGDQRTDCVQGLQKVLQIRGAAIVDTGSYAEKTTSYVAQFQEARGLPATGVADNATLSQLTKLPSEGADWDLRRECVSMTHGANGDPDSAGPCVTALRKRLNDHGAELPDGKVLDEQTDVAVRAFQMTAGLPAQGLVGPLTKNALYQPLPPGSQPRMDPACQHSGCTLYLSRSTTQALGIIVPSDPASRYLLAGGISLLACWQVRKVPRLNVACQPVASYILDQLTGAAVQARQQNACLTVSLGYPQNSTSWAPLSVGVDSGAQCHD